MRSAVFRSRKGVSPDIWDGLGLFLSVGLVLLLAADAQPQTRSKAQTKAGSGKSVKADAKAGQAEQAAEAGKGKAAAPGDGAAALAAGAATRKGAPNEIIRDPRALDLLDIDSYPKLGSGTVGPSDIEGLKSMAQDVNAAIDRALIERVVNAMVARLTDHANIQALIDPPPGLSPSAPSTHAIHDATTALLVPLFQAKAAKNQAFLVIYVRELIKKLEPLLKNHLVPRIQAMIILGQAGSADAVKIYQDQLKDPKQTVWVKLWALEGINNIVRGKVERLTGSAQIETARIISDFLEKEDDVPWPAQLRALQALGAMRQGFLPIAPRRADMANTAMKLLVDTSAKPEVRAEAARALGLMQITSAVQKYNFPLVAHTTASLAADLGGMIESTFTSNPPKAKYFMGLLAGPVFQAFEGVDGARDSGLLHANTGASGEDIRKIFEQMKPVMKAVVDLNFAPRGAIPDRRKDLAARVASLRDYLEKVAPADHRLVPGGPEYPAPAGPIGKLESRGTALAG